MKKSKKKVCRDCKEKRDISDFYVCISRGKSYTKSLCKMCFNLAKEKIARRKKFLELTNQATFKKYEKLKENQKGFSSDAKSALKERDIKE